MPTRADITEYERTLRIEQPSQAMPTAAQVRAMRAIDGDNLATLVATFRTRHSLVAKKWAEIAPSRSCGYALTAAGRAAMGRY